MAMFRDRVAIVTGGASGIGQALCEELARKGAMVVVADIDIPRAEQVASVLTSAGHSAWAVYVDVTKAEEVQHMVDETVARRGRLDYMFNNAGIGLVAEMRDMSLAHWRQIVDVNLWGVIYGTDAAYRVMVQQESGISSTRPRRPACFRRA
jgi:NAD(P)-dependent dehydrogenase (short-subunit alcohol dehydrogenase family)